MNVFWKKRGVNNDVDMCLDISKAKIKKKQKKLGGIKNVFHF